MDDLDFLDYDSELTDDAKRFGLKAQGGNARVDDTVGTIGTVHPAPVVIPVTLSSDLREALIIAKEVYGETNSAHSEVFCHWVDDALLSATSVGETKEMLSILHEDKEGFGGRLGWKSVLDGEVVHLKARRHAAICAMNIVRAVLNKLKGIDYEKWVERSLYRATKAEGDAKGEPQ